MRAKSPVKTPLFDGVYGLNKRNRDLVAPQNPPRLIALAKDKVACKKALEALGIPTPREIAVIRSPGEVDRLFPLLEQQEHGFVMKPSRGALGRGVMLFARAEGDGIFPLHGPRMGRHDFQFFVASIVSGEYTSGRPVDCVLVEERIRPSSSWVIPDLPGAPDLRVIVYLGVPVMAMIRFPTAASGGRANLHRGGVGVGIDLDEMKTSYGIWKGKSVTHHPDSGAEIGGRTIEGLEECLELSRRCVKAVPLGYMGVDIMLDEHTGPSVIEINARPGLSIQLANRKGLGTVCRKVASRLAEDNAPDEG